MSTSPPGPRLMLPVRRAGFEPGAHLADGIAVARLPGGAKAASVTASRGLLGAASGGASTTRALHSACRSQSCPCPSAK